jgi:adenylate cyclase
MRGAESQVEKEDQASVLADLRRALTREVLKTELIRIKALIVTMSILAVVV